MCVECVCEDVCVCVCECMCTCMSGVLPGSSDAHREILESSAYVGRHNREDDAGLRRSGLETPSRALRGVGVWSQGTPHTSQSRD